jgi:glycosyltransferase involved in cell wall biosynthesis
MTSICLSMIVKDESEVVARCLTSVKSFIDSWCVVDTGSTDDTREIVRALLHDVPGTLHDRPWRNFGANRTEALALAFESGADYALVNDADDILEARNGFTMPVLVAPTYALRVEHGSLSHYRPHFFRRDAGYRYEGVVHEYATNGTYEEHEVLDGLVCRIVGGGARSRVSEEEKFLRDAKVLRAALVKDPTNARYVFYLAQSYRDAGHLPAAIASYERRAGMTNGFYEEVFVSLLEIARARVKLSAPEHEVVAAYMRAFEKAPRRAEPLFELARYFRSKDRFAVAYVYAKACVGMLRPPDRLFVNDFVYDWAALDEFAINAFYVRDFDAGVQANESLLANAMLPESERPRIEKNLEFCLAR